MGGIFCLFCLFVLGGEGVTSCAQNISVQEHNSDSQEIYQLLHFFSLCCQGFLAKLCLFDGALMPLLYKFVTYITIINTLSLVCLFLLIHISYVSGCILRIGNSGFLRSQRTCTDSLFTLCVPCAQINRVLFDHFILKYLLEVGAK